MSDTLKRWECPECGVEGRFVAQHYARDRDFTGNPVICPGVPVERVYVAVDCVEAALAFLRSPNLRASDRCARAEQELVTIVAAATEEKP